MIADKISIFLLEKKNITFFFFKIKGGMESVDRKLTAQKLPIPVLTGMGNFTTCGFYYLSLLYLEKR